MAVYLVLHPDGHPVKSATLIIEKKKKKKKKKE